MNQDGDVCARSEGQTTKDTKGTKKTLRIGTTEHTDHTEKRDFDAGECGNPGADWR